MPLTKFGGDGAQRFPAQRAWLVHHHLPIMIAGWLILEASTLMHNFLDVSPWLRLPLLLIGQIIFFWCMTEAQQHSMRTCERCVWNALREDGQQKATEKLNHLRRHHWHEAHPVRHLIIAGLVFLFFITVLPGGFSPILIGTLNALLVYLAYITRVHSRYQRWCPWCRRWDDGDWTEPADPGPDPTGQEIPTPPKHVVLS